MATGVYNADDGEILFEGRNIAGMPPHRINRLGIARTFQNIRLWGQMTVLDNIRAAMHQRVQTSIWQVVAAGTAHAENENRVQEEARELLAYLELTRFEQERAKNLPYGEQRRLEIARALATHPRLILLDEPAAGMNTGEKVRLMDLIRRLQTERNLTVLLIEHDMKVVMESANAWPYSTTARRLPKVVRRRFRRILRSSRPTWERRQRRIETGSGNAPHSRNRMSTLLQIDDLHVSYGAIRALRGISFEVDKGAIVTLIGANGAGKTTLLRTISGLLKPKQGRILYWPDGNGESKEPCRLSELAPHEVVRRGIAQVPEDGSFSPISRSKRTSRWEHSLVRTRLASRRTGITF